MPLPSDLPATLPEFERQRQAARAKYERLVRNLGTMEFVGLMEVVTDELTRRNLDWKKGPDAGSRIGR